MRVLTGVGWHLEAAHRDAGGAVHGHTWDVTVWHECEHKNDAVVPQTNLKMILRAYDHQVLPDELARAEDFAVAILNLSPASCVEVEIRRESGRLYARATR